MRVVFSKCVIVALWALLCFSIPTTRAQSKLTLSDVQGKYPLGSYLEILQDTAKAWTIDDVSALEMNAAFTPNMEAIPNFGFTNAAYWVRFHLDHAASQSPSWWLEVSHHDLDLVDFYVPGDNLTTYEVSHAGRRLPFVTRNIKHPNYLFSIPRPDSLKQQTVYLRFESEGSMTLPLTLWSIPAFAQKDQQERFIMGLFYGLLLIMLGYNLFIYFSLRESSYLYYVLFLACFMVSRASGDGLAAQYLWPEAGMWNSIAGLLIGTLLTVTVLQFTSAFLNARQNVPRANLLIKALMALWTALLILLPFIPVSTFSIFYLILVIPTLLTILGTSVLAWKRGYQPARLFLLAWGILIIATFLFVGVRFGLLPSNLLTEESPRIGMAFLVLFLSLALVDRINFFKKEKEVAQAAVVQKQREALQLKDEMNAALHESKEELEARNAELERFAYTVSHDLKSPLVTIRGFLGLMEQSAEDGNLDRMHEDAHQIREATDKMKVLLDELLELSRIGRLINPPEEIPLSDLAQEATDLLAGSISIQGVQVNIEPNMPIVHGDRLRLLEVFQNLIANAIKFMGSQTNPMVDIGGYLNESAVHCYVRDNGMGIEPAYLEKIFGLFERLDTNIDGTGIGLTLAKRIVEVHDGRIWVESDGKDKGATFYFTLPHNKAALPPQT